MSLFIQPSESQLRADYKTSLSLQHIQPFLLSICSIYTFIVIHFNLSFPNYNDNINIFFTINITFLIIILLAIKYYYDSLKHSQYLSQICHSLYFISGTSLALSVYLLYIYLPTYTPLLPFAYTAQITIMLIVSSLFFTLCHLSHSLHNFLIVSLPIAFPIFFLQPTITEHTSNSSSLLFNFIFFSAYIAEIMFNRKHKQCFSLFFELKQDIKSQNEQSKQREHLYNSLKSHTQTLNTEHESLQKNHHVTLTQFKKQQNINIDQADLINTQKTLINLAQKDSYNHVWQWDLKQSAFYVNNQFFAFLRNDACISQYIDNIVHPNDTEHFLLQLQNHLSQPKQIFECECRIKNNNVWTWFASIGQIVKFDEVTSEPTLMVGLFKNIEKEKQDQNQINLSSNIIETLNIGIITLDKHLNYVNANPFFCRIVGREESDIVGKNLFGLTDKYTPQQRSLHFSVTEQIKNTGKYIGEFEEKFKAEHPVYIGWHIQTVKDKEQNILRYIGIISDLTEHRKQERRLSFLENYDTVTQLPNRFYYNFKVYELMLTEREQLSQVAIIYLSIDRFNALNEFLGTDSINILLKSVAERLSSTKNEAFIIASLNRGDFALAYELNQLHTSIEEICGQIILDFTAPFQINRQDLLLTVSLGVAIYPEHALDFEKLNNHAYQALVQAQHLGGNTIQYYSKQDTLYVQDVNLENELRYAIKNNGLEVFYQPKISLKNNIVIGFEALIRWNHPSKGLITPGQFLSFAKQTSMVSEIGQYVLEESAKQIKKWQIQGFKEINVSINIDPQQLYRGELLTLLDDILEKNNLEAQYLEFELTESALIEKTDYIKTLLTTLKERGIQLSLDDFGTGYSSLAYLTNFPFDAIKIDQHFIQNMGNHNQYAVLNAIIAMGKAMSLTIIAEGVETAAQLQFLKQQQCDIVQGYIYSKPLCATDATAYLQQHSLDD